LRSILPLVLSKRCLTDLAKFFLLAAITVVVAKKQKRGKAAISRQIAENRHSSS